MKTLLAVFFMLASQIAQAAHVIAPGAHLDLETDKVAHITGDIMPQSLSHFAREMKHTEDLPGDRLVIINSNGGNVEIGSIMIQMLLNEKAQTGERLVCVVQRNAHSMAFNLLSFCDVRVATVNSHMIVHKIRAFIDPRVMMTAKNLRQIADYLEKNDERFRQQNSKMMHLSLKDYDLYADNETEWRVAALLKLHYLDGVATISP